ncbi:MAG: hypothetical protein GF317_23310 [Candidatus Lokiarchaeota archaeon]|nr:hypothetical protein [Candidatus Lokiarchaeota archaeon]
MEILSLKIAPVGQNGLFDLRNQINEFVNNNFGLLYEGAVRMGCEISADYYAPKRVQTGDTRLHETQGLKYADGHKYSDDAAPSESQLRQTVKDLQALINAASKNIAAPFILNIIENEKQG